MVLSMVGAIFNCCSLFQKSSRCSTRALKTTKCHSVHPGMHAYAPFKLYTGQYFLFIFLCVSYFASLRKHFSLNIENQCIEKCVHVHLPFSQANFLHIYRFIVFLNRFTSNAYRFYSSFFWQLLLFSFLFKYFNNM